MTARLVAFRRLLALIGVLWLAFATTVHAQDYPPRPDGPVYDGADIISPATEAELDERLRAYNRETGRALIVATIPSLEGAPLESYATGLFANWGIGGAERDQGLLLLIARDDRKMRIEVGYGLHPYFGGIMAGRVIRDEITPSFKEGDFDGGIVAGIDAITAHLAKSPAEAAAIEEAERAAEAERGENAAPAIAGVIFWIVMIVVFAAVFGGRGARGRKYRGGGGVGSAVGNVLLWTALNAAMNSGRGSGGGWGGGGGGGFGGGGGGFGGFGGGMSGGGGASGGW